MDTSLSSETAGSQTPPFKLCECAGVAKRYTVEIGRASADVWAQILAGFDEANLYQTWPYSAVRWGENRLVHLLLKQDGRVVAAAQVILIRIPLLPGGLAYVKWGPLWQDESALENVLIALNEIFVRQKRVLLRVTPWEFEDSAAIKALGETGFRKNTKAEPLRTVVLDLEHSLEDLRASLTRHWRANLKNAERSPVEIVEGSSDELMNDFLFLYAEMRARKASEAIPAMDYLPAVQRALSDSLKMRIAICRQEGAPVAGLIVSALGSKAFAVAAATGAAGRESRGSYLLQWRMIQWLKERRVRWYDLARINEKTHPGTTQFKLGLSGKLGIIATYAGDFESSGSRTNQLLLDAADWVRNLMSGTLSAVLPLRLPWRATP